MSDYYIHALEDARRVLRDAPLRPAALRFLQKTAAAASEEWNQRVIADIPAFTESRNPHALPSLASHCSQHVDEIQRLVGGGAIGDFGFVRQHARLTAEQRFPLEVTLHAYRCGSKIFSRWMRDATSAAASSSKRAQQAMAAVSDFAIEYTDAISTVFAGTYLTQARFLAEVATDRRAELLGILLDGYDESDGRVAAILKDSGYLDGRQSFCVVLARSLEPAEMLNSPRARRLADAADEALRATVARRVVDVRGNRVVMVLSDLSRVSGFTRQATSLSERVAAGLAILGPGVLVGVSRDVPSTSQIPSAFREAKLALELSNATQRVTRLADLPMRRVMLFLARDSLRGVLPPWTAEFRCG